MRFQTVQFPAIKGNSPALRPVMQVDAVEQAGLAGTVGADNGVDIPFFHRQIYFIEDLYAAERKVQVFYF